jgi:hypothetical protein
VLRRAARASPRRQRAAGHAMMWKCRSGCRPYDAYATPTRRPCLPQQPHCCASPRSGPAGRATTHLRRFGGLCGVHQKTFNIADFACEYVRNMTRQAVPFGALQAPVVVWGRQRQGSNRSLARIGGGAALSGAAMDMACRSRLDDGTGRQMRVVSSGGDGLRDIGADIRRRPLFVGACGVARRSRRRAPKRYVCRHQLRSAS